MSAALSPSCGRTGANVFCAAEFRAALTSWLVLKIFTRLPGVDLVWEGGRAPYTLHIASSREGRSVSNLYGTSYRFIQHSSRGPLPCSRNLEYFKRRQETIAAYSSKTLPIQEQIEKYCLAIGMTPEEISALKENNLE